ncbi:MAG: hypothetical protein ACRDRN_14555 [Sciscionella sp.]
MAAGAALMACALVGVLLGAYLHEVQRPRPAQQATMPSTSTTVSTTVSTVIVTVVRKQAAVRDDDSTHARQPPTPRGPSPVRVTTTNVPDPPTSAAPTSSDPTGIAGPPGHTAPHPPTCTQHKVRVCYLPQAP